MPLPEGSYYRVRTTKGGKRQRLAFDRKGKVIEVTPMKNDKGKLKAVAHKRKCLGKK